MAYQRRERAIMKSGTPERAANAGRPSWPPLPGPAAKIAALQCPVGAAELLTRHTELVGEHTAPATAFPRRSFGTGETPEAKLQTLRDGKRREQRQPMVV